MSVLAWFRRLLDRVSPRGAPPLPGASSPIVVREFSLSSLSKEDAAAIMAAYESGSLDPPRGLHEREAWDRYWNNHLALGAQEQNFSDWMSSNPELPKFLAERGARTLLCAGNGLSIEAFALALHGFRVTAMDISTVPAASFEAGLRDPQHPCHRIAGIRLSDDGSVSFDEGATFDPELIPPMHRSADYLPRGGGALHFVSGDLFDPAICPGPFDVVIERRCVQLFPRTDQPEALERLIARLSPRGTFISHEHQGFWKPGDDRTHYAERWVASHGFAVRPRRPHADRLADLIFSTG